MAKKTYSLTYTAEIKIIVEATNGSLALENAQKIALRAVDRGIYLNPPIGRGITIKEESETKIEEGK